MPPEVPFRPRGEAGLPTGITSLGLGAAGTFSLVASQASNLEKVFLKYDTGKSWSAEVTV